MPITHTRGCTVFTGVSITFYQIAAQKAAVELELKGIRLHRGPVLWKLLKAHYRIDGGKLQVYAWLCAKVEELRPQQVHIVKE